MVKSGQVSKSTNKQIRKTVKQVLSKNVEHKFFRVNRLFSALDYNGFIEDLSYPSQNITDSGRVGDRIVPKSLHVGVMAKRGSGTGSFRLIVFRWKCDTIPAATDILFDVGTQWATTAPYQHDGREKFNILLDKHFAQGAQRNYIWSKTIKLGQVPVQYQASGTTGTNKIYCLCINDAVLASSPVQAGINYSLNYTDA